jgi:DNA-binding transcriptional regulator GbsR (MarR family)
MARSKRTPQPQAGSNDVAVERFVESFALTMAEAGFPRMAARVFVALLVADDGRRTAAGLAEYLHVSRAAVSGAVNFLVQARFIVREREPRQAVDHFRVLDDLWVENMVRKDTLLLAWEQGLAEGVRALRSQSPAARRLEETRQFFAFVREEFPSLIERWRHRRDELRRATKTR